MEEIVFRFDVVNQLDDLVFTLFKEDYFSYSENAKNYVDKIVYFTINNIETFPNKITPSELVHLGEKYIFIKQIQELLGLFFLNQVQIKF